MNEVSHQNLAAFGDVKSLADWANDPKCCVDSFTLAQRVEQGWSLEIALTTDPKGLQRVSQYTRIEALGQTQLLKDWAKDPRCNVEIGTLRARIRAGWEPEKAITAPPAISRASRLIVEAFGEEKSTIEWAQDPRCKVTDETLRDRLNAGWQAEVAIESPPRKVRLFKAFGEEKTLKTWADDSRCNVSYATLRMRVFRGWEVEDAISRRRARAKS